MKLPFLNKSFGEIFDSEGKKIRLSHIKNMVCVALADNKLRQVEKDLIVKIALGMGLEPLEIERIIYRPESVDFYPPKSYNERLTQLHHLVMIMMCDGEIDDEEKTMCKILALQLGFKSGIVDGIIDKIILEIASDFLNGIS